MISFQTRRLIDLCTKIGSGATPHGGKETYLQHGHIFLIRSQNVLDFFFSVDGGAFISEEQARLLDGVKIQKDDVLINITGDSVARVCSVPDYINEARVNQHVAILRTNPLLLSSKFLKYYLLQPHIKSLLLTLSSAGATRKALTKSVLENFEIDIPSLPLQHRIAEILGALDDKIELNRQMNHTLEAMTQALYKHYFVNDIDPENLPKGWRNGKLREAFNVIMGQSPDGKSYNSSKRGILFFQGRTDFGFRFPDARIYTTEPKRFANKFDTLVSVRAPVGDINMADDKCCIGRGLASVQHKSNNPSYTFYTLKVLYPEFETFNGEGTVFGSVNKDDFNNIDILIPSLEAIMRFEKTSQSFDGKIFNNSQENAQLSSLRDTLLPKLISGEIIPSDLKNIENLI